MALSFPHSGDTAYVAQCYPYTYTKLQKVVTSLVERPNPNPNPYPNPNPN